MSRNDSKPIRSAPQRIPVRLYLHPDIVTASPDGAVPIDCICVVIQGTKHTRVDLVWVQKESFDWLGDHGYLHEARKPIWWKPVNEVLRASLSTALGTKVEPIPFSLISDMPEVVNA